jgi:outer membrane protein OmpA-like peptidoglycan-associated protein
MKFSKWIVAGALLMSTAMYSCSSMNKTQKGAVIGTAGGAAVGGVIGRASGNTALGAIIGAAVGGATGAIIGKQMDKQAEEIKNEIPDATIERVGEGIIVEFKDQVLFGFDRADLSSAAKVNLDKLVSVLNKYPDTDIEIQGHTDNKGTDKYNLALSEKRAVAVADYLRTHNIAGARLTVKGYGESAPKYGNGTEADRSKNRRVEFLITANEKMKQEAKNQAGQ